MKVTFNKFSVILMYLMVVGFFAYVLVTKEYPPTSFTIAYFGFWICQSIVTAKLYKEKKEREQDQTVKDVMATAIVEYLNEDNIEAIIEQKLGVDLKRKK